MNAIKVARNRIEKKVLEAGELAELVECMNE